METTRHNFIKTSGALLAGSVITTPLLHAEYNAKIPAEVNSYLNHFEVTTNMLQKIIAAADDHSLFKRFSLSALRVIFL
jgi:TldD protein